MTTIQDSIHQNDLPEIGQPLADGTFFVRHWLNGKEYAYVDLGKSAEFAGEWGEYDQDVDGAVSYRDGASNTVAMAEAGSPIAKQAMEIGEGVFIPSILELALLFSAKQAGEPVWFRRSLVLVEFAVLRLLRLQHVLQRRRHGLQRQVPRLPCPPRPQDSHPSVILSFNPFRRRRFAGP